MNKFKFCCYEIDRMDDEQPERKIKNGLMLGPNMHSKIKFQPGLTNTKLPICRILEQMFQGYRDLEQILPILQRKRVNPQISEHLTDRDDLEYYIPQLITYMVIERNLEHKDLNQLVIKACLTDFYFAHCVYFYLQSLTTNTEGDPIEKVRNYIQEEFLPRMEIYSGNNLTGHQIVRSLLDHNHCISEYQFYEDGMINQNNADHLIYNYGTAYYDDPPPEYPITIEKVKIKNYCKQNKGFLETPKFWSDLVDIGQKISAQAPDSRSKILPQLLKKIVNINLPATVYVPFFSDKIRYYTVLNVWQGRIFSTKQRAPFSIWLQIYRQEQQQKQNVIQELEFEQNMSGYEKDINTKGDTLKKLYQKISKPFSIIDGQNTLKIKNYVTKKKKKIESALKKRIRFQSFYQKYQNEEERPVSLSLIYETRSDDMNERKSSNDMEEVKMNSDAKYEQTILAQSVNFFSQSSDDTIAEYRKRSIYRNLKSWRMMHLMVKIGDDLRQEQFAMQLIYRFQYIFQKQNVPCILKPYQVIALGPDYGLIEMINDVVTLDGLFKKLGGQKKSLRNFFDEHYKHGKQDAKRNFMRSLAGYSLVTYFLQVKDRHNGNILLHKNGSIIHIDFGFFLSNAPGKGVELQKKVPFKLLTQYVQVIGQPNSEMFFQFRRLFYRGFKSILRNKGLIISLVKMMYKSHQGMMNCFLKGQEAIEQLQNRMNPEGDLQHFCYNLINNSLDNWRAKWYDKFQYFFQKIYY